MQNLRRRLFDQVDSVLSADGRRPARLAEKILREGIEKLDADTFEVRTLMENVGER